VRVTP
jgi:hypothetical protein